MTEDQEDLTLEENEEQEEVQPLSAKEQLEAVLFQFITLYDSLVENRQIMAKQAADINKLVQAFSGQVAEFGKLDTKIKGQIRASLQEASQSVIKEVGREVGASAAKAVEQNASYLSRVVHDTEQALAKASNQISSNTWKIIASSLFCSIVTAVIIAWFLMPSRLVIDDNVRQTWNDGVFFQNFWPKLDHAQKQWLTDLAEGKVKNRGKAIEDIKAQYSGMDDQTAESMANEENN